MDQTSLILIVLGSIFLGLGVIFLIIFNVIFLLKRHYLNVDYKLKNKYNHYQNSTIGSNIRSIESIVNKNIRLAPIRDYLNQYRLTYEKQLEIVKIKLRSLSNLLKTYKLSEIRNLIKQLNYNFDQLDKQQEEYRKFNLDTQKYSNDLSNIATGLFDIISSISNFNKDNMLRILYKDVKDFNVIDKELNENSLLINNELDSINSENTHRLLLKELSACKKYLELSKKIYEFNQYHIALDVIINEIKNNFEKLNDTNDDENILLFSKKINSIKQKSKQISTDINFNNIPERTKMYVHEINKLEDDLKNIKLQHAYEKILKSNLDKFDESLNSFFKIINQHNIKELCKNILIKFKNNNEIEQLAINDIELAKKINQELTSLNTLRTSKNIISKDRHEKIINYMISIYELIINFKENNEALFNQINKKNKDILLLTFRINDLSLKLLEIEQLISENKIENKEIEEKLTYYKNNLEQIKKYIAKDILIENNKIKDDLDSTNDFINDTLNLIINRKEILAIVKNLKMYANRFKNDSNLDEYKIFTKLEKEHKYYDLIDQYIIFINKNLKNKKVS